MTDVGGSSFPAVPVVPGGGRRPWLVVGLVVAFVTGSLAIARLTSVPRGETIPTVVPTPTLDSVAPVAPVAPIAPIATALPQREWFSGPAAPIGGVLVEAGHVRWLRFASARLTDEVLAEPGRDLLLRDTRGGTVCLCWRPVETGFDGALALDIIHLDASVREQARATVKVLDDIATANRGNAPAQVAMELSPDGRFAYLVSTVASGTGRQVVLDVIDIAAAAIVDSVDVMRLPGDDRAAVRPTGSPTLRIAPDGRHALVSMSTERQTSVATDSVRHAWMVGLDGASVGQLTAVDKIADVPPGSCSWTGLFAAGIVAKGCVLTASDPPRSFGIRRHDLGGQDLGRVPEDAALVDEHLVAPPLLDLTNGRAYMWNPVGHSLLAADVVRGVWGHSVVPPDTRDPAEIVIMGVRPAGGAPVTWSDGRPSTDPPRGRLLVGSPDGRLLFAAGFGEGAADAKDGATDGKDHRDGGSSGIWVFDAQSLALLERWPALATYESITLIENGRWLMAIGRAGVTADGLPAEWGTSLTAHDALSGRRVLRIGDLGVDGTVTLPAPRPVVPAP